MAIKSFLRSLFVVSLAAQLSACRTAPKAPVANKAPGQGPLAPSPLPTPKPEGSWSEPPVETPPAAVSTDNEPKRVAVILGPGGAKALAHVGVLKALQRERVPIGKLIGLEWGALIGGLFANKGQVHDVEWKLYKMEQQDLPRPRGFFPSRNDGTVKIMEGYLNDAFGKEDVASARIPFACPARSLWSGIVAWQNRGPFKDIMKRCLAFPPVLKVQGSFIAGASQATEAVELLAKEGYNVIILVNVLGSAMPVEQDALMEHVNTVILWQEIKRAIQQTSRLNIETINVDTSAKTIVQFEAKKELIQMGEVAGQKAAAALVNKYGF